MDFIFSASALLKENWGNRFECLSLMNAVHVKIFIKMDWNSKLLRAEYQMLSKLRDCRLSMSDFWGGTGQNHYFKEGYRHLICLKPVLCHVIVLQSYLIQTINMEGVPLMLLKMLCYLVYSTFFMHCVSIFTVVCYTGITKQVWLLHYIPAFFMSSLTKCVRCWTRALIKWNLRGTKWPDFQQTSCLRNLVHSKLN